MRKPSAVCAALAGLLSLGLLTPVAPARAGIPVSEPDLDNIAWVPPAGHTPVGHDLTLTPGVFTASSTGRFHAQEAREPSTEGHLQRVGTACDGEPGKDSKQLHVYACFRLYKLVDETDGNHNFFFEEFDVGAMGRNGTRLSRVKGRLASSDGENERWMPKADQPYGTPTTETYQLSFSAPGPSGSSVSGSLSRSTPIYPGRIHPYSDRRLFHSSWISNNDGVAGRTINSDGMNVWRVPETAGGIHTEASWRVWCDCY